MKPKRTLKIEEQIQPCGYHRQRRVPMLRLKGKWMAAAGFNPGQSIELTAISPGVIEIRVCSPVPLTGDSFQVMGRLDAAIKRADAGKARR